MSSNPKKRQPAAEITDPSSDESDGSCSENGYSGDEEQSSAEDEIQIDIEGQAITENETASIQWFLKELLPEGRVDVTLAAKEITAQKGIGSVVKSDSVEGMEDDSKQQELDKGVGEEGEEENDTVDTLGVTTVLAVSNLRDNDLSKQIVSFLQDHASNSGKGSELGEVLKSKKTNLGWLIHERFPSIPTGIAPYLLRTVLAELKAASAKGQPELTHFVVITKAYDTASPAKQSSSSKGAAKKPHLDMSAHELVYEYPEMELFVKEATVSFSWDLKVAESGVCGVGDERRMTKPMRVALLLPAKTFELLVSTLEEALQSL